MRNLLRIMKEEAFKSEWQFIFETAWTRVLSSMDLIQSLDEEEFIQTRSPRTRIIPEDVDK